MQARERAARLAAYQHEREAREAAERAAAVADANGIWNQCAPRIARSLAEHYLVEIRKIPRPASGWPACLGIIPTSAR